ISAYSLVAVTREARKLMIEGGSIVTQTYLGAERVIQNYNGMGVAKASLEASVKYLAEDVGKDQIRVRAISPRTISTLADKGVSVFNERMSFIDEKATLRRNVDREQVGDVTMFVISELAHGIPGEIVLVDSGNHIICR